MKQTLYIALMALALSCPLQSCANGSRQAGDNQTADDSVEASVSAEASSRAEALDADGMTITKLLNEARQLEGDTNLPLFFARRFLGIPYVAHTLEVNDNDKEQLVVNTRQLDCTTLVETVTALTLCAQRRTYTYEDYRQALTAMRFRKGIIDGYPSRIHYFTDWIVSNTEAGIVSEVQAPNPPFTALQTVKVNYMSQHPQSYKALSRHPEYVAEIARMEQRISGLKFRFIPKSEVNNSAAMRQAVHDGDIVAITCSKPGLDIAHLGFAVWHDDGLHLLNASQLHKKVVEEPMTLRQYLQKHPSHTGIRIIRIIK